MQNNENYTEFKHCKRHWHDIHIENKKKHENSKLDKNKKTPRQYKNIKTYLNIKIIEIIQALSKLHNKVAIL